MTEETITAVDRLFPERCEKGSAVHAAAAPERAAASAWQPVLAEANGYIQDLDGASLLDLAKRLKVVVRIEKGIGEFVVKNAALASLSLDSSPDAATVAAICKAFSISRHRTVDQDPAFGIRQIVDMALKALSPGVNDTSTAVMCVDHLTAILGRLAGRTLPPRRRYEDDVLRLIARPPTFESLLSSAFDQIRRNAKGNVAVLSRLLGALEAIGEQTESSSRLRALREQAKQIGALAERTIEAPQDRARLGARLRRVRHGLGASR